MVCGNRAIHVVGLLSLRATVDSPEKTMQFYYSDFVADVYDFMSPFYLTTVVPHVAIVDTSGQIVCTSMSIGTLFLRVWFRRIVFDLNARKRSKICLIDRVECRESGSLVFYPVSRLAYQALVPQGPLYPLRDFLNLRTATLC